MTRERLAYLLYESRMFNLTEIKDIITTVGQYTLGNAVIACEILGIKLYGSDIDDLYTMISQ